MEKKRRFCINVFKELVTFMLFKPIRNGFHPRQNDAIERGSIAIERLFRFDCK